MENQDEKKYLSYVCKACGCSVLTENEKKHDLLCTARSRVTAFCGYCGAKIFDIVFYPRMAMQDVMTINGKMLCKDCEMLVGLETMKVLEKQIEEMKP